MREGKPKPLSHVDNVDNTGLKSVGRGQDSSALKTAPVDPSILETDVERPPSATMMLPDRQIASINEVLIRARAENLLIMILQDVLKKEASS